MRRTLLVAALVSGALSGCTIPYRVDGPEVSVAGADAGTRANPPRVLIRSVLHRHTEQGILFGGKFVEAERDRVRRSFERVAPELVALASSSDDPVDYQLELQSETFRGKDEASEVICIFTAGLYPYFWHYGLSVEVRVFSPNRTELCRLHSSLTRHFGLSWFFLPVGLVTLPFMERVPITDEHMDRVWRDVLLDLSRISTTSDVP